MGYMHIDNLYKNQAVLAFKEVWVLEKIHGTSANVTFKKDGTITYHSGGASHDSFVKLFDEPTLKAKHQEYLKQFGAESGPNIVVYGEAFGGKMQKMSDVYGPDLDFVAFEVSFESEAGKERFLPVDKAVKVAESLGLKFVWHTKSSTDLAELNKYRDAPSQMGLAKGLGEHQSEGIVIRPLQEYLDPFGNRIIAKHKTDNFRETKTIRPVDTAKLAVLESAAAIAKEWVTEMRLDHLLDKHPPEFLDPKNTPTVIKLMQEDITREAKGEIVESKEALSAIGKMTSKMFIARCKKLHV